MKLPSIIYAIAIGLAASVQAQDKATNPNETSKLTTPAGRLRSVPDPAVNIGTDANGTIHIELNGGRLVGAIAEIEGQVKRGGAGALPMPNLIYSADEVREFPLPGKFRLTGVTPVQAVALACAAAGCKMEPIFAPAEEAVLPDAEALYNAYQPIYAPAKEAALPGASGPVNPGKVIGYRIVRASASGGDSFGSRIPNATRPAGGGASKGEAGGNTAPGAASSRRNSLMPSPQSAPSAENAERVVRVYALGAILGGGEGSAEELKRRYALIGGACDLIARTLEIADLKADKSPEISLHSDLRVIVAKATAAQHDIILQVLQALKENETHTAQTAKPAPSAETILPTPTPAHSAEKPKSNP